MGAVVKLQREPLIDSHQDLAPFCRQPSPFISSCCPRSDSPGLRKQRGLHGQSSFLPTTPIASTPRTPPQPLTVLSPDHLFSISQRKASQSMAGSNTAYSWTCCQDRILSNDSHYKVKDVKPLGRTHILKYMLGIMVCKSLFIKPMMVAQHCKYTKIH